jgi:four helix bundle protein
MAKVERFQDLRVCVAVRELVKAVYEATALRQLGKDYALRDQTRRAAISVPSNVAEGFL